MIEQIRRHHEARPASREDTEPEGPHPGPAPRNGSGDGRAEQDGQDPQRGAEAGPRERAKRCGGSAECEEVLWFERKHGRGGGAECEKV